MRTAIFPGSFDPLTNGHLHIIARAAETFDEVIVCVLFNSAKHPLFTAEERVELITRAVKALPNVRADCSSLLIADYAKQFDSPVLIKGIRSFADFEYERQMAQWNRTLNPKLDTLFFFTEHPYSNLSSSAVKELARFGKDISAYLPGEIVPDFLARMKEQN